MNASGANTLFIDAYLAEVTFIDGTALDASSFGQFKAGVWSPKPTSDLTFGVNGFYLRFKSTDINSTGSNRTDPMVLAPSSPTILLRIILVVETI